MESGNAASGAEVGMAAPADGLRWQGFPAPVIGGGLAKTTTEAFQFNALPDTVLLGWLAVRGHRPNLLIECPSANMETAMRHLMTWCALPFRYCSLPGKLELPVTRKGTLLLKDVAALTLSQQVAL